MKRISNRKFLYQVIGLYHSARKPKFINKKVSRGRSHSVSSAVEDLFAYYLATHIKCDDIYTDQPVSIVGFKNQIYPDLVITRDKRIIAFIDLKMDMGWNRRGLYSLCRKHYDRLNKAKGKECRLREGMSKKIHLYTIDKRVTYNIVLISDQNINPDSLERQIKKSYNLNPDVEVFALTAGEHPNTYGIKPRDLVRKIKINNNAFKKLINKLKR